MKYVNIESFNDLIQITHKDAEVFLIHDFFKSDVLEEMKNKLREVRDDKTLWGKVPLQEDLSRRHLINDKVELFSKINDEFNGTELIEKIKQSFNWDISRGGFNVWHDSEGYDIPLHVDNDRVRYAIQIYLGGKDNYLGTSFSKNPIDDPEDIFMTIPYKENFGYCMKNVDSVKHGLISKVPKDFDRYSLYALFE